MTVNRTYLKPGSMFVIPLANGNYAYGYVVFDDQFVWVNIFDFETDQDDAFEEAQNKPLLMRDLMVDRVQFTKSKRIPKSLLRPWALKRSKKFMVQNPLPPIHEFYIIGGPPVGYIVISIRDRSNQRPATEEDVEKYQAHIINGGDLYTTLVESLLWEKEVVLDLDTSNFLLVDRDENALEIKKPYVHDPCDNRPRFING